MSNKPIILIEFNELCPPLLERWISAGELPNFARFRDSSQVFTTESDEPAAPNLEPWIQWYSLHTGLPFKEHKIFHLTDGPRATHDDVWHMLAREGLAVCNFSSMNARRINGERNIYLGDPWCNGEPANPAPLNSFQNYVAANVREYSNAQRKVGLKEHAAFVWFLVRNGLRLSTGTRVLRQLAHEFADGGSSSWKRASLLDLLMFDVFTDYYRRYRPDFATFFCNSTAHFQHSYWRHMNPAPFANKPSDEERRKYENAILHGYKAMDNLLEDFFALEREGATLILATALSQQPFLKWEAIGGQRFYRPHDVEAMLRQFEIDFAQIEPVMTHQFMVRFANAELAANAQRRMLTIAVDGVPIFQVDRKNADALMVGNVCRTLVDPDSVVRMAESNRTWRYGDLFYLIDATKSGAHHPDGVLWIKSGTPAVHRQKVSILDVLPTILDMVGVPHAPESKLDGISLLSQFGRTADPSELPVAAHAAE
ncbi:MAG: alkaline phosphatase family protein [Rhodospirillaceae bacterium]|nr:alkaline phosphatase family protein [Rhodospirillaceae bacterium]